MRVQLSLSVESPTIFHYLMLGLLRVLGISDVCGHNIECQQVHEVKVRGYVSDGVTLNVCCLGLMFLYSAFYHQVSVIVNLPAGKTTSAFSCPIYELSSAPVKIGLFSSYSIVTLWWALHLFLVPRDSTRLQLPAPFFFFDSRL